MNLGKVYYDPKPYVGLNMNKFGKGWQKYYNKCNKCLSGKDRYTFISL